jgi:hypothetical protein
LARTIRRSHCHSCSGEAEGRGRTFIFARKTVPHEVLTDSRGHDSRAAELDRGFDDGSFDGGGGGRNRSGVLFDRRRGLLRGSLLLVSRGGHLDGNMAGKIVTTRLAKKWQRDYRGGRRSCKDHGERRDRGPSSGELRRRARKDNSFLVYWTERAIISTEERTNPFEALYREESVSDREGHNLYRGEE